MPKHSCRQRELPCGQWSTRASMNVARELFAAASGPDRTATGTASGVDQDPRVYVIGGLDANGSALSSCEKYNPNTDSWEFIASLPQPLGNCMGSFAPDYGGSEAETLGFIYVAGDNVPLLFRYNIRQDSWETLPLPFSVSNASLQYLDDVGGPLAQLLIDALGVDLPACSDGQTLWIVGGDGTERTVHYIEGNQLGQLVGDWIRGPDLPLLRVNPIAGRVFWRDAGITSFGVSNCASIAVCGGLDENGQATRDVQLLVREDCDWRWITANDNPTSIPRGLLTLAVPVASGDFGTEQWPETLVTGGRALVFGGVPPAGQQGADQGSVQLGQFRFTGGRYRRDPCLEDGPAEDSDWNTSTSMPILRTNFRAEPLSQASSLQFADRRVSRFLCVGGRDSNGVTARAQLFELPVPPAWLTVKRDRDRCRKQCPSCSHKSSH